MSGAASDGYPDEVEALHRALARLPGAQDIASRVFVLSGVTAEDLGHVEYARLPHAALRRTNGGLDGEMLVQTEFRLEPDGQGWRSLEFIAWFVRDMARGGEYIQLRPFGLPPSTGERIQLGHTLRFQIELFGPGSGGALMPALAAVRRVARGLELAIELYRHALMGRAGGSG